MRHWIRRLHFQLKVLNIEASLDSVMADIVKSFQQQTSHHLIKIRGASWLNICDLNYHSVKIITVCCDGSRWKISASCACVNSHFPDNVGKRWLGQLSNMLFISEIFRQGELLKQICRYICYTSATDLPQIQKIFCAFRLSGLELVHLKFKWPREAGWPRG